MRTNSTMAALFVPAMMLALSALALAGGPAYVAGTSYFDPTVKGTPLTWPPGAINYYTDQGDLSPILLGANADSFVANAFGLWTSIPTGARAFSGSGRTSC